MDAPSPLARLSHEAGWARSPLRAVNRHRLIPPLCGEQGTARFRSLDIFDPSDWRLNPEGCQKVAGGRLGQRGTTTGRPRARASTPEGMALT